MSLVVAGLPQVSIKIISFMRHLLFCLLGGLLCCCSETIDPDPSLVGYNYFPLEIGFYRTYQVNEITISLLEPTDTSRYQRRALVADTFHTQNETNYVLHLFSRKTDLDSWNLDSVWTARRTETHAVVVENNVPFLKLVFPVREDKTWDGNLFNALPEDEYEITDIGGGFDTPAGRFEDLLTVFENDNPDTLIFQDIRKAIYAPNVGLIYQKSSILNYCNTDPGCLGTLESGKQFDQILIDFGYE
jgi:hypothetical protein